MFSRDFFKRFFFYFTIILIINFFIDLIFIEKEKDYQYGIVRRDTNANLRIKKELIQNRFDSVFADLEFLKRYLEYGISSGKSVEKVGVDLVKYVATFGEVSGRYHDIYVIDTNGMEILKIKYFLGRFQIAPRSELESVRELECYGSISNLGENEYLFLGFRRCENDSVGSIIFRFASSLYNVKGKKSGTLVIEYYGDTILRELGRFFYYLDSTTYLLDSNGNIIYYVTPSELESRFIKRGHVLSGNFERIYPGIWTKVRKKNSGEIRDDKNLYSHIYMNIPERGRRTIGVNFVEKWREWQIVSVTNIHKTIMPAVIDYGITVGIGSLIVLIFVGGFLGLYVWSDMIRKSVERSLRDEASFFKNTPFPVLKTDYSGFVLGYNKKTYECFGRDIVGLNVVGLFKGLVGNVLEAVKDGRPIKFEEDFKDKKYIFTVVQDRETKNCFFYGDDVTDLKEKERELKILVKAIEQSDEAIFITDAEGTIIYVNNAVTTLTGYRADEVIGKNPRIFKSGQMGDDFYKNFWATITSGRTWEGEFLNRRKDGSLYWEKAIVTPVRNELDEITNFIAIKEDTSVRKEAERILIEAKKKAEESSKLKTLFLANMSHEIRTPMNAVLGFTQLLLENETDSEKLEQLRIIKSSGEYLLRLINDILDLSKIEANKLELQYAPFSVRALIEELKSIFGMRAAEKGIEFHVDIDETSPDTVIGDEHRIRQIIVNLLGNAIKFTDRGYVKLNYTYSGGNIVFSVEDTGIGIDSQGLKQIFAPFKQMDESLTKKHQGTGLGLSISKRLAELMGGEIEVWSEVGRGSRFVLRIPAKVGRVGEVDGEAMVTRWIENMRKDGLEDILLKGIKKLGERVKALSAAIERGDIEEVRLLSHEMKGFTGNLKMEEIYQRVLKIEEEAFGESWDIESLKELFRDLKVYVDSIPPRYFQEVPPKVAPAKIDGQRKSKDEEVDYRILVVEDNSVNLTLIVKLLERMGLECDTAENGKIALEKMEKLKDQNYDLVLLDINMPVMDGVKLLNIMKERNMLEATYVIALTAYAMRGEAEKYLAMGFHDYISKPIETKAFEEKIKRVLGILGD